MQHSARAPPAHHATRLTSRCPRTSATPRPADAIDERRTRRSHMQEGDKHNGQQGSSRIRRSASAARRARSRASSGISCLPTVIEFTGNSYDNTLEPSAERPGVTSHSSSKRGRRQVPPTESSWLMMSDVCKHCTHAGCLEACPTGAIIRNEFDDVFVQPDVCNGCGYCVPSCPFGVVDLIVPEDYASARLRSPSAAQQRRRTAEARRRRRQVHALLRPPENRLRAGLRESVPDRIDSVRRRRRTARRARKRVENSQARGVRRVPLRRRSRSRRSAISTHSSCSPTSPRSTTSGAPVLPSTHQPAGVRCRGRRGAWACDRRMDDLPQ